MAGINISFASDVRSFLKGTGDAEQALEDVADALDDLARDAADAGDEMGQGITDGADDAQDSLRRLQTFMEGVADGIEQEAREAGRDLETGLEDGTKDSERAVEKMERKFRDVFDDVERRSRDSGDAVGDHYKKGYKRAEKAAEDFDREASNTTEEFKEEAISNFSEVASSFQGDMDSIADLAQGTFGGLALKGGPIGLAAGALAAVGGGFYQAWKENAEKTKGLIADMYDDMLESGEAYLSEQYIQQKYWEILKDESDVVSKKRIEDIANYSDLTMEQVALAFAGNEDMMARVHEELIKKQQEFQAQLEDNIDTNDSAAKSGRDWVQGMIDDLQQQKDLIARSSEEVKRGEAAWDAWGRATDEAGKEAEDAYGAARTKYQGLNDEIRKTPRSKTVKVDADTTAAERKFRTAERTGYKAIKVSPDFTEFDRAIRNKRPVIVGVVRAGKAAV